MLPESGYRHSERPGVKTQPAIVFNTPEIDVKLLKRYSWAIPLIREYAKHFPRFASREIPIPYPEMVPGGQLYQVHYCGVCGSDRKLVHMDMGLSALDDVPGGVLKRFTLGHEIVAMDEDGQVGVIYTLNSCLKFGELDSTNAFRYCEPCKAGNHNLCEHRKIGPSRGLAIGAGEVTERSEDQGAGFTHWLAARPERFIPLPEGFPHDKIPLAVLTDAISCGFNAAEKVSLKIGLNSNEPILVIGGGMIGFGTALALKSLEYSNVKLLARYKFQAELARRLGVNTMLIADIANGDEGLENGFRAVIESVGTSRSLSDAFRFAMPQGDVIELGLAHDVRDLDYYQPGRKELTRHGVFWSALRHYHQAIDAIRERLVLNFEVEELINPHFSLYQGRQAFSQRGTVLKNVFVNQGE